jgi:hypothetical protein
MLGTLAKWLRIYGFDTFYANNLIDDEELLKIAEKEKRIIITRDKELIYNAKRRNLKIILISTTDLDEQLNIILKEYKIDENLFLSRCTLCNNPVKPIEKKDIKDRVPPRVFENNENFWYCSKCDKIYWKGSHCEKMIEKTKKN